MLIAIPPLTRLVAEIFRTRGCPREEAERIGASLVAANLAGHDSHGVVRVPRYVRYMDEGKVHPGRQPSVLLENEVMAVLDGHHGFGQSIGPAAVELGIAKASRNGIAVIALRNSGHLGRIGEYAEMAAERGQVSVHFVNVAGATLVAPFGGVDRRFSTAPVAVGVPAAEGPPVILDFATSIIAEGKALVAHNGGKPLPEASLIGPDGRLSADPALLYGSDAKGGAPDPSRGPGALRAMGEHKGSGLALVCELLAGALTGSGCAGPEKRPVANGMVSIFMALEAFGDDDVIAGDVRAYVDYVKSSRPAVEGGEVLVPGEPEGRTRAERLAQGVPLADAAWAAILETARQVGLSQAEIDAALATKSLDAAGG